MVVGVKTYRSSLQNSEFSLCCVMKETSPLTSRIPAAHIGHRGQSLHGGARAICVVLTSSHQTCTIIKSQPTKLELK